MRLTTTQKVQIRELRGQNLGYKRIAKALDLNVGTVKSFLLRHPCDNNNYCRCCGKPIVQTDKRKRLFCSKKCKDKYWHTKTTECPKYFKEFTCVECGKPYFVYTSVNRRYCSRSCFQKHESRKWQEEREK